MCHITETELALLLHVQQVFLGSQESFSSIGISRCDDYSSNVMKDFEAYTKASRAASGINPCVVIWHIVSFRQFRTYRPESQEWQALRITGNTGISIPSTARRVFLDVTRSLLSRAGCRSCAFHGVVDQLRLVPGVTDRTH